MAPLSDRMQAIFTMAGEGEVLADVGCDHGFLSIALCEQGHFQRAIAMDVRKGPLQHAAENIGRAQLTDRIELRLSDGLQKLSVKEADTIIIAGMGGPLMQRILTEGEAVAKEADALILQPQSEIPGFRRFLMNFGFVFLDEDTVLEDHKYYFPMKVVAEKKANKKESYRLTGEEEFAFGKKTVQKRNPAFVSYLNHELRVCEETLLRLNKAKDASAAEVRREELIKRRKMIMKLL